MNELKEAVKTREAQLKRQINASPNPLIKQILEDEIKKLQEQWQQTQQTKTK